MGHRQNELKDAAGLLLKLRIIVVVQDPKISIYMQVLVPSLLLVSTRAAERGDNDPGTHEGAHWLQEGRGLHRAQQEGQ